MSRATRTFLLAGCALVLALEAPLTARVVAAGWNGPYATARDTAADAAPEAEVRLEPRAAAPRASMHLRPDPLALLRLVPR